MLVDNDTASCPVSGRLWTRLTRSKRVQQLADYGYMIGERTAARLLKSLDYRLLVNHKSLSAGSPMDRDAQFQKIAQLRARGQSDGVPLISVDTKKKEMIGRFKNAGAKWGHYPDRSLTCSVPTY